MFVVSVVCCQVDVSATSWSLVQMNPTDCGASLCDLETSRMRRPWPALGHSATEKKLYNHPILFPFLSKSYLFSFMNNGWRRMETFKSKRKSGTRSSTFLTDFHANWNGYHAVITIFGKRNPTDGDVTLLQLLHKPDCDSTTQAKYETAQARPPIASPEQIS